MLQTKYCLLLKLLSFHLVVVVVEVVEAAVHLHFASFVWAMYTVGLP